MAEEPREGLDLRPDGTVHVWLDGTQIRLRRPKGREFRQLREQLGDIIDSANGFFTEAADAEAKLLVLAAEREDRGEPLSTPEEDTDRKRLQREVRDRTEGLLLEWWPEVFALLASKPVKLDLDDLPIWMLDIGLATSPAMDVLTHWRERPLLSGGPEAL